jgi:hypothetical protein
MTSTLPTPCGSPEAARQGCTCDPVKNHHGHGAPSDNGRNRRAFISADCPLHSSFRNHLRREDEGRVEDGHAL